MLFLLMSENKRNVYMSVMVTNVCARCMCGSVRVCVCINRYQKGYAKMNSQYKLQFIYYSISLKNFTAEMGKTSLDKQNDTNAKKKHIAE